MLRARCMISKRNVKLLGCDAVFVFFSSVLVISGIIKVSVSVISLGLRHGLDLDYSGYHKTESNNCLLLSEIQI